MILECFYHVKGNDKANLLNKKHSHDNCYELIQTISNGGNFVIKDTLYSISSGTIFLINAIDIHCSAPQNPDEYVRNKLVLNSKMLDNIASLMGFEHVINDLFKNNRCASVNVSMKEKEKIDDIFANIYDMYIESNPDNNPEMLSLILHFLQICFNNHNENKYKASSCVSEAIQYINDNVAYNITLSQLSEALFVTKNHLCKQFKKTTGLTISEYIKLRRISIAKKKLQFSDMSVSDVSLACGFSNFSYFSKLFRKYEGITPTQYRNKYTR